MEYALTATKTEARAGSYYDKIAHLYDLTFKLNGYGRSLDQYFETHPLPISRGARILDAGCGTGLLTLALTRNLRFPVSITALDLSAKSVTAARMLIGRGATRQNGRRGWSLPGSRQSAVRSGSLPVSDRHVPR